MAVYTVWYQLPNDGGAGHIFVSGVTRNQAATIIEELLVTFGVWNAWAEED